MRGADSDNESLLTTVKPEDFAAANHPLRPIRTGVNDTLAQMDVQFSPVYMVAVKGGRPSIAPEKLVRAPLLQALYSFRSERQLVEHRRVRPRPTALSSTLMPARTGWCLRDARRAHCCRRDTGLSELCSRVIAWLPSSSVTAPKALKKRQAQRRPPTALPRITAVQRNREGSP